MNESDAHPPVTPEESQVTPPVLPFDLAGALSNLDAEALRHFAQLAPEPEAAPAAAPVSSSAMPGAWNESMEELADDMLALLKRVKTLEEQQTETLSRLELLRTSLVAAAESTARESDALRRELLGERKHLAMMSAFLAVAPGLERLQIMRGELDPAKDRRTLDQLHAVVETLSTMLRGLGFTQFEAQANEPFDSTRMECVGFDRGEPNVVLKCVRAGFLAGQTVVRPAGVLIANPRDNS